MMAQFVTRERLRETPEVHVAGLCIDPTSRKGLFLLLAKRAERRKLYGGLIEGCGGQLARSESFPEGVVRHFRMEMGIEVRVFEEVHCFYEIREPDEPLIPGIRFLCERVGDREPHSANHEWVRWVCREGLPQHAEQRIHPGPQGSMDRTPGAVQGQQAAPRGVSEAGPRPPPTRPRAAGPHHPFPTASPARNRHGPDR
jgi:hypothetical protein